MASSSGSLTSPSPSPTPPSSSLTPAKKQSDKIMPETASKPTTNGRRAVDEESELSDLSDEGSELDDDEAVPLNGKEEEEDDTEPANTGDAEESKDEAEENQSGKSSTVTSSRSRRKKAGSLLPGPMWDWAYKPKADLKRESFISSNKYPEILNR